METKTILIADDEFGIRESLEKVLSKAGCKTLVAGSGSEALAVLNKKKVDLVLTDLKMPDGGGLELLKEIKKDSPDIEIILLTGYGSIEIAVEAMREGAYDFIAKPPKKAIILNAIEKAIERFWNDVLAAKFEALQAISFDRRIRHGFFGKIGQSPRRGMFHFFITTKAK